MELIISASIRWIERVVLSFTDHYRRLINTKNFYKAFPHSSILSLTQQLCGDI